MNQPHLSSAGYIERDVIDQYLIRQGNKEFVRDISNRRESVGYQPDSSLRFWYNDSMNAYDAHWHSAVEMIIPVEGNYLITIRQQTYELRPGDIFLIPGGELHALRAPSRGSRFLFLLELDPIWKMKGTAYLASCFNQPLLINRSTCPSIYEEEATIVTQMIRDYLQDGSLRDITIYTRLLSFLIRYARFRMSQEGSTAMAQLSPTGQRSYAEKFNAVLAYMDRHFAEDLTLEHVAAVAGFSKFHFSRTFKQLSGENFYDYLCYRRIKSSETLLMKPGMSISQIALQSGFSSVSTFNRTFKKVKGCTPTQYRSLYQLRDNPFEEGAVEDEERET